MKLLKVYGCPRSGTNFLDFLIKKNFKCDLLQDSSNAGHAKEKSLRSSVGTNSVNVVWKHGVIYKKKKVNNIFISKDPYSWIISYYNFCSKFGKTFMFMHNAYKQSKKIIDFIDFEKEMPVIENNTIILKNITPIEMYISFNKYWLSENILHIQHSNIVKNPIDILNNIEQKFSLERKKNELLQEKQIVYPGVTIKRSKYGEPKKFNTQYVLNEEFLKKLKPQLISKINKFLCLDTIDKLGYKIK